MSWLLLLALLTFVALLASAAGAPTLDLLGLGRSFPLARLAVTRRRLDVPAVAGGARSSEDPSINLRRWGLAGEYQTQWL